MYHPNDRVPDSANRLSEYWKQWILVGALFLAASDTSRAQVVRADTTSKANRNGSWSAMTSSGQTLMGSWTAVLDTAGTVTGTWAIIDAKGETVAVGGWSAAKASDRWTGVWRANVTGRNGEFSGTWTATVDGKSNTRFADLFEQALQTIVSGTWRMGERSGPWSIRTFK